MTDTLEDHEGTVSTGGGKITNLHFADDIDGLAGEEEELANLVERLDKAPTAYGMEISREHRHSSNSIHNFGTQNQKKRKHTQKKQHSNTCFGAYSCSASTQYRSLHPAQGQPN